MIAYAQRHMPLRLVDNWRQATRIVDGIPEIQRIPRPPDAVGKEIRCHEVARVVAGILCEPPGVIVDGQYGAAEHSWLEWTTSGGRYILDCYACARVPMVQLIDVVPLMPEARLYVAGEHRTDIWQDWVDAVITHLRASLWWKDPVAI